MDHRKREKGDLIEEERRKVKGLIKDLQGGRRWILSVSVLKSRGREPRENFDSR